MLLYFSSAEYRDWYSSKDYIDAYNSITDEFNSGRTVTEYFDGSKVEEDDYLTYGLRTPGEDMSRSVVVYPDGSMTFSGASVDVPIGVRPALWLSAVEDATEENGVESANQEAATGNSESDAEENGGHSFADIERNIVGTWVTSTPQGEEKLRFMDDGAFESTSPQGIVSTGSYYFEDETLYVRMQTFLGTFEQEFKPSMDSSDSLWLSRDGDSINYTRKN
jgi:hypothetical protein